MSWQNIARITVCTLFSACLLSACQKQTADADNTAHKSAQGLASPIEIQHQMGVTQLTTRPQRVAALDMNEVDFLDQLEVPIAGMVKDFIPHFLEKYQHDATVQDLGAIVQPNMERVHALQPDLILMTANQANHYQELSEIAPTLYYDVDYSNSQGQHFNIVKQHLLDLGKIFDKEALAQQKITALEHKLNTAQQQLANRPEKALVVMHNNGAFSAFGPQSRYAFVFDQLGVKSASQVNASSVHGQPISSEFIQHADPDILYIIDRTAVMEHRPVIAADQVSNPLLRQTKAWKNGRVIFVDADAWYVTAASVRSLHIVIDDVLKGYATPQPSTF
ncbi:siderophore ABC transporter substrate-binding protein [Acinetobacter larvae]|uniref:Ferric anguibactin-binding protein n=1 Tax=Acinetobacter larvae TaxID=1789224 RepID=A0A1B2LYT1_9GAMM|nr:siderophore ABC transporter substrate-binding protein [Acinetobacter larvae]AOA58104.1 ferric anguibactin-binding protein [Acinetobacter larvae]